MAIEQVYDFEPDFLVVPGETLLETLEELEISQAELARRTGRPLKTINGIVKGNVAITPETAIQFEKVLGVPARFWLNLESDYQEALAKQRESEELLGKVDWLKQFPISQMVKLGWIQGKKDKTEQLKELFSFFGVASIKSWEEVWSPNVAFRKSETFKSSPAALAAWLRMSEIEAHKIECKPFDRELLKRTIPEIRKLTLESDPNVFIPKLVDLCSKAGVAVVFLRELPGCRASGATKWIGQNKVMITLSLRYKSNDHIWFTFFHEVGHVLLHGKKITFIDEGIQNKELAESEEEANEFASHALIPKANLKTLIDSNPLSKSKVINFADEIGVAPGIVVGRLQFVGAISFSYMNDLKQFYKWN